MVTSVHLGKILSFIIVLKCFVILGQGPSWVKGSNQDIVTCTLQVPTNFSRVGGRSLAFVIDMSSRNMTHTINQLKLNIEEFINSTLAGWYTKYILIRIYDHPIHGLSLGPVIVTLNSSEFVIAVKELNVSTNDYGPTCAKPLLTGINAALDHVLLYSQIYMFTVSTAKDTNMLDSVLSGLTKTQNQVYWISSSDEPPCETNFTDVHANNMMNVVAASGGSILIISPTDTYQALKWIRNQYTNQIVAENYTYCNVSGTVECTVDVDDHARSMSITEIGFKPELPTFTVRSGSTPYNDRPLDPSESSKHGSFLFYKNVHPTKMSIATKTSNFVHAIPGMCGMQVRLESSIHAYIGYTNDIHSDMVSATPLWLKAPTNIAIVHVADSNGSSHLTLDHAQLFVWVKNSHNIFVWDWQANISMHHRAGCSYEYYSDPFSCPGNIFVVKLFGHDGHGYQWSKRISGQCREATTCTARTQPSFNVAHHSLAFVVDMYNDPDGFMSRTIAALKTDIQNFVTSLITKYPGRYAKYILVQVYERMPPSRYVTELYTEFVEKIKRIGITEHDDPSCTNPLLGGIQKALDNALNQSQVYVFSASTAKDTDKVDGVLSNVITTQNQVNWITVSPNLPCQTNFTDAQSISLMKVVAASAGSMLVVYPDNIGNVLNWLAKQYSSQIVAENFKYCNAGDTVACSVDIDSYADGMCIVINGWTPANPTYNVQSGSTTTYIPYSTTTSNYDFIGLYRNPGPGITSIGSKTSSTKPGMCGMQVRIESRIHAYIGYTNDPRSDVLSTTPPSLTDSTNIAIVHLIVSNISDAPNATVASSVTSAPNETHSLNVTIDHAQLFVWASNIQNIYVWVFHSNLSIERRTGCSYEYYSSPFSCPGDIFAVNLVGYDGQGYQWSRRIPGQCRDNLSSTSTSSSTSTPVSTIQSTSPSMSNDVSKAQQSTNATSIPPANGPTPWWIYLLICIGVVACILLLVALGVGVNCYFKYKRGEIHKSDAFEMPPISQYEDTD